MIGDLSKTCSGGISSLIGVCFSAVLGLAGVKPRVRKYRFCPVCTNINHSVHVLQE